MPIVPIFPVYLLLTKRIDTFQVLEQFSIENQKEKIDKIHKDF